MPLQQIFLKFLADNANPTPLEYVSARMWSKFFLRLIGQGNRFASHLLAEFANAGIFNHGLFLRCLGLV
jgi:hypothetical protein